MHIREALERPERLCNAVEYKPVLDRDRLFYHVDVKSLTEDQVLSGRRWRSPKQFGPGEQNEYRRGAQQTVGPRPRHPTASPALWRETAYSTSGLTANSEASSKFWII